MITTSDAMVWENVYKQAGAFHCPPPWNIGEPQPELANLIRDGKVSGDVLDAGCGHAELSLALAAQGYTVVGIDVAPSAVAAAATAAQERGLNTAAFVCEDITSLTGYDGRFSTIIDSTLFHSLSVQCRDDYLRSIQRAAAPGAHYYVLVFAEGAFPAEVEDKPHEVDEDELRTAVSKYFEIDEIRSATIYGNIPEIPSRPPEAIERDQKGRVKLPAYLLSAHKA